MSEPDVLASIAKGILRLRRQRADHSHIEMFSEPAWDILLELFVADAQSSHLTGQEIAKRCLVAPNVISRWLCYLSASGLLVGDGTGNLDDSLTLSSDGLAALEAVLLAESKARDPTSRMDKT